MPTYRTEIHYHETISQFYNDLIIIINFVKLYFYILEIDHQQFKEAGKVTIIISNGNLNKNIV